MWPFKPSAFLDAEDEAWQLKTWQCFLLRFGGVADLKRSPLVTPSATYFPPSKTAGHARAEYVFDRVKRHAGMEDWPCKLVEQPARPEARVSEFVFLQPVNKGFPLGTFGISHNEVVITYDPASLGEPMTLVATFAHELAHYRLAPLREELPGGEETHEFATDLMTVYMGFGIFGADQAFNFSQHQDFMGQGWKWSRQGYLPQRAWVFALAIFLQLRQQPMDDVKTYLKDYLFTDLKNAQRSLQRRPGLLAALR